MPIFFDKDKNSGDEEVQKIKKNSQQQNMGRILPSP